MEEIPEELVNLKIMSTYSTCIKKYPKGAEITNPYSIMHLMDPTRYRASN